MTRATFWEWFDKVQTESVLTESGKAFAEAGFKVEHNGGGTTAWERPIAGTDWFLRVTDLEGFSHTLDLANFPDDRWLIAAYQAEGEAVTDCYEAASVAEAVSLALELERTLKGEAE